MYTLEIISAPIEGLIKTVFTLFFHHFPFKQFKNNKIEKSNIYDKKGIFKLTYVTCNEFYIGRTNRNFKIKFKEHKRDFIYFDGKYKLANELIDRGHEITNIEEIITNTGRK